MDHLSQQQIVALIDGRLDDAEEHLHNAHLAVCTRCRNEVALQRSLGRIVHDLPLEKTSQRFTERTMKRVLHAGKQSFSYKVLQHVSSVAAMAAVLVVLGYILSSPSELFVGTDNSATSEMFTAWKTFYTSVQSVLSQGTAQVSKAVTSQTTTPASKIITTTLLVLVGLAALDRFVFQKMVRTKM